MKISSNKPESGESDLEKQSGDVGIDNPGSEKTYSAIRLLQMICGALAAVLLIWLILSILHVI